MAAVPSDYILIFLSFTTASCNPLMDRVYDCDNRFVPPKIKIFYLVFLGKEDLGKKRRGIKILNIQSNVSEQCHRRTNPRPRGVMVKRDMQALRVKFRNWLQSVPPTSWHDAIIDERDAFLEYFDGYDSNVYQKLLKHPFLKGACDRFAVMFEIKRSEFARELVSSFDWSIFITRLTSIDQYDSWRALSLPKKLLKIYEHEDPTYEDGPYELVKFLRNVYVHLQEPPETHKIEKDVRALYPGFFTRIYQAFPHIGTNII